MNKSVVGRNIVLNYGFTFFKNMNLTSGIWMLLLISKGQSLFEVGLLEGIFHVTSFCMETPTGAVADLFGRKSSRLISVLLGILSLFLIVFSYDFWGFAFGFMMSALSYNFESGAGEAFIYDSLVIIEKENQFMAVTGKLEVIMQLTSVLALFIGGWIGRSNYQNTYFLSIGILIFALLLGLLFKEPQLSQQKPKEKQGFWRAIGKQYGDSFRIIKENKRLAYLIAFSAGISTFLTLSFFYIQVQWKNEGYHEGYIGLFLAVSCILGALGGILATRIDQKLGERRVLIIAPFVVIASIFTFAMPVISIVGFAIVSFVESIIYVTTRDYIHKLIPSEQRATIISFESTVFSSFMITLFPLFGAIAGVISTNYGFLCLGGLLLFFGILNVRILQKKPS